MAVPDTDKMTFEQAIEELESIIGRIESGKIGLAESLAEYQRGAALLKRCRGVLEVAEQKIEKLSVEQAGESATK